MLSTSLLFIYIIKINVNTPAMCTCVKENQCKHAYCLYICGRKLNTPGISACKMGILFAYKNLEKELPVLDVLKIKSTKTN